jgi:hypothetical protein
VMGQRFVACDREQSFLMPPDVRDWLAEDHLAWFVIDAVAEMDLEAFYVAYRQDGRSRPAYDPAMMVAVLLYAYARGTRSSRQIERGCEETSRCGSWRPSSVRITRRSRGCGSSPGRDRRPVRRGLVVVRETGAGQRRRDRSRRDEAAGQRESQRQRRLRAARARDSQRSPSTRPRTSSMATRAATSCPNSCAPARAVARGCARPSASWSSSAPGRHGRFRGTAPSASKRPSGAWTRSCGASCAPTAPMSTTGPGA